jgi:hypothetical protein
MHDASKDSERIDKSAGLRFQGPPTTDRGNQNSGGYVSAGSSLVYLVNYSAVAFTIFHVPNFGPGFFLTEAKVARVQFNLLVFPAANVSCYLPEKHQSALAHAYLSVIGWLSRLLQPFTDRTDTHCVPPSSLLTFLGVQIALPKQPFGGLVQFRKQFRVVHMSWKGGQSVQ